MLPLTLRALLFVRELAGGDSVVFPVAEPALASFGPEEEALDEQRVFLAEHLARAAPEIVARHGLPADTSLRTIHVRIPREDLPARLAVDTPIAIPLVLVPTPPDPRGQRDTWVFVVPLDSTVYVRAGEDLEETVAAEVKGAVIAREVTPLQYLDLLPGVEARLEAVEVVVARAAEGARGGAGAARKALAERESKKAASEVLMSVARPMRARPAEARRPLVGREKELALLTSLLKGEERTSAVLIGPDRVGKTALLEAWIDRAADAGHARAVFATSGAQLIAGMSSVGQWQERVRRVMEAAERLDAVLFFDDLGDLLSERGSGGFVDLPGFMKPYLEEGRVRLMGELRSDQVDRAESSHVGFFTSLAKIRVPPMTAAESAAVLRAHVAHVAKHDPGGPQVDDGAIAPILDLAERYLPYEAFPGKAVRLHDELRAGDRLARHDGGGARITPRDVFAWFSLRTGVPTFLLRDDDTRTVAEVSGHFERRLVGQPEAIRRVAETVCVVKAGVQPEGKPLATFLFVGPTGVGKTELARALAELLFGSAERLIRFDMSEYEDAHAAERLFRGTDRGDGLLTRQVREQPFSVVLLDEIEKAHPAVFDLLLQVCGEGRLTDGKGKTAYFHNTILILTSNLGAAHRRPSLGFDPAATREDAHYLKAVHDTFRPELVNRLDRIVAFRALTRDEALRITRLAVKKIAERSGLVDAGIAIDVDEEVLARLAEGGFSAAYGARALRRHVEEVIVAPVAGLLSAHGAVQGADVVVRVIDGSAPGREPELRATEAFGLRFALRARAGSASVLLRGEHAMREIATMRREIHKQRALDRVEQLRDRVSSLVAQLGHGTRTRGRGAPAARGVDIAAMQAEHHRLAAIATALDQAFADVCGLEELAIEALFGGHAVEPMAAEVRTVRARFRGALVRALVAEEPLRDSVTLLVQEIGSGRALDLWLAPLLAELNARSWQATLHLFNGERAPSDAWPASRKWGPPRSPAWALERIARGDRPSPPWLLRVTGPDAGILLALENGLHRVAPERADDPPSLLSVLLVTRKATLTEVDWTLPALVPPTPPNPADVKGSVAARDYDPVESRLTLHARRAQMPLAWADYWPHFEEIALTQLLLLETNVDRDAFLAPRLRDAWDDVRALVKQGRTIDAIKIYRQRTGLGLRESKLAVEALGEEP